MTQWVRATWVSRQEHSKPWTAWGEEDLLILGHRGAPLKICAAAACLLAQRAELIPQLESALDHLLIGAVLLDHALDWADDLAAGRYNAFVAYASGWPQTAEHLDGQPAAVAEELLVGKAGQPYFPFAAPASSQPAVGDMLVRLVMRILPGLHNLVAPRDDFLQQRDGCRAVVPSCTPWAIEGLFVVAETHVGHPDAPACSSHYFT